ncbi:reverse transcriptase (RNA-dependent DNA polymerase) [Hirsutella rhossiliensis]
MEENRDTEYNMTFLLTFFVRVMSPGETEFLELPSNPSDHSYLYPFTLQIAMSKNTNSTRRTILSEPQDWDKWNKELRARVDETIHGIVFEEGTVPLQSPARPTFSEFAAGVITYAGLTSAQQKAFSAATSRYENMPKMISLREEDTLRQWMTTLESSTAPTKGFMTERIRKLYSSHLRSYSKSNNIPEWLVKWEEIIQEAIQYFLMEALTGQWLRDIATIIKPLSDGYATIFLEESRRLDEDAARKMQQAFDRPAYVAAAPWKQQRPRTRTSPSVGRSKLLQEKSEIAEQQPQRGIKRGGAFLTDDPIYDSEPEAQPKRRKRKEDTNPSSSSRKRCPACENRHELSEPSYYRENSKLREKAEKALKSDPELQRRVNEINKANPAFVYSADQKPTSIDYPLRHSTLLDSAASLHARNEYLVTGDTEVRIEGYGRVNVTVTAPDGTLRQLRLKRVAYCPRFSANLVSFQSLQEEGIYWDTFTNPTQLAYKEGRKPICVLFRKHRQFTTSMRQLLKLQRHEEGPLETLGLSQQLIRTFGTLASVTLALKHSKCLANERTGLKANPNKDRSHPCEEIWIDWTDLSPDYKGFVRVMFITDAYSGMIFPYFLRTYQNKHNWGALRDFVSWMKLRFDYSVKTIRSDGELFTKATKKWLRKKGISAEPSSPNTQSQNGGAERSGGALMERARKMRIAAKLPHDLWKETVEAACYLKNRTPRNPKARPDLSRPSDQENLHRQLWMTPLELFTKKKEPDHNQHATLQAYGFEEEKATKLDPRTHIGYLVISTRDVTFDERTFFDGKLEQPPLLANIDELVENVSIPEDQQVNQEILDEESESEEEDLFEEESDEEEAQDQEKANEELLLTPPPSEDEFQAVLSVFLPVATPEGWEKSALINPSVSTPKKKRVTFLEHLTQEPLDHTGIRQEDQFQDRFRDFYPQKIRNMLHGTFNAGRIFKPKTQRPHKKNLPEPPETQKQLERHPYKEEFIKAQKDHLASHEEMGSFLEVPWKRAAGKQILGCKWVFIYKTDKHGILQNRKGDLPTRATTLAGMSFRALMAISAEFDLELDQMDAVNAFVNCPLEDEVVYMRMPPGFVKPGRVLLLRKALYGLRRSPLLWQQHLTGSLKSLGFQTVPQEPCVMRKGAILVFFYVDDIIWAYKKGDQEVAKEAIRGLQARYQMTLLGEPRWFLGIHILRDRSQRTIWLTQDAYIEKIAHKLLDPSRLVSNPLILQWHLRNCFLNEPSREGLFTQISAKVGSILFAAISTRPDVAFAVSRLARHNQNPGEIHQQAADRVILYLYATRSYGIRLGGNMGRKAAAEIFLCSSDASFADNSIDRKSSQGYVMTLFGGPIAWRASKQATFKSQSRCCLNLITHKPSDCLKKLVQSSLRDFDTLISISIGFVKRLNKEGSKSNGFQRPECERTALRRPSLSKSYKISSE